MYCAKCKVTKDYKSLRELAVHMAQEHNDKTLLNKVAEIEVTKLKITMPGG